MASPTFFRLSGLALLVGGLVFAIAQAITVFVPGPLGPSGPPPVWDLWISAVGGLILLIGLPALYTVQSKQAGMVGLLGSISIFVAFLLLSVVLAIITAIELVTSVQPPSTGQPQPPLSLLIILPIGMVLLIAGSILFGIATLRTRAFESWAVWAFMVLPVLLAITFFLPFAAQIFGVIAVILFMLLFVWFGYKLAFQTNTFVGVTATAAEPSTES